jgi:DNA polymerase elongation subunit (family B)
MRLVRATASESPSRPVRIPALVAKVRDASEKAKILDFDVETVAAGFADPDWVPQKITCVAWSWVGSDKVESRICGPEGIYGNPPKRAEMLAPLLEAISEADMLTGHNILRFDLPVINAECMRLGLDPIREKRVQDTMKLVRTKGFKKGQDNLETLFQTRQQKLALNWQEWQDAYDEKDWKTIRDRAETDVVGHKQIRQELIERDLLKPPVMWRA